MQQGIFLNGSLWATIGEKCHYVKPNREGPDQTAHPHSMTRDFGVLRRCIIKFLINYVSGQRMPDQSAWKVRHSLSVYGIRTIDSLDAAFIFCYSSTLFDIGNCFIVVKIDNSRICLYSCPLCFRLIHVYSMLIYYIYPKYPGILTPRHGHANPLPYLA